MQNNKTELFPAPMSGNKENTVSFQTINNTIKGTLKTQSLPKH